MKQFFIAIIFVVGIISAMGQASFPLPAVPDTLTTRTQRANYLALHYWDNIDFNDSTLIGNEDISEQGFCNFISIMPYVTQQREAFEVFVQGITCNKKTQDYFMSIGQKYLAEPQSPVYNEALYIVLLEAITSMHNLSISDSEKYNFMLRMEKRNQVGTVACDFEFLLRDGTYNRLHNINTPYTLIFFGDPDCEICNRAKEQLEESLYIKLKLIGGYLTILSVCVEGKTEKWQDTPAPEGWIDACDENCTIYDQLLYDIPGLPSLYLLDKEHRVVLRDVNVESVEQYFSRN